MSENINLDTIYDDYVAGLEYLKTVYPTIKSRQLAFTKEEVAALTDGLTIDSMERGEILPVKNGGIKEKNVLTTGVFRFCDFISIRNGDKSAIFYKLEPQVYKNFSEDILHRGKSRMEMYQKTDEGLYKLTIYEDRAEVDGRVVLWTDNHTLTFFPNSSIEKKGVYGSPTEFKEGLVSLDSDYIATYYAQYLEHDTKVFKAGYTNPHGLSEEEMLTFFNRIYKLGLPALYKMMDNPDFNLGTILDKDKEKKPAAEQASSTNPILKIKNLAVTEQILRQCQSIGLELTPEQKIQLAAIERFKLYKEREPERKKSQQEYKDRISSLNDQKERSWIDPEYPSTKHAEELASMFETSKRESQFLETVNNTGMGDVLSKEQMTNLQDSQEFLQMMELSSADKRQQPDGMTDEVRQWYQEHYKSSESDESSKHHKM